MVNLFDIVIYLLLVLIIIFILNRFVIKMVSRIIWLFTRNHYKKPIKCNILEVDIGGYADDSVGIRDYRVYYKLNQGKIRKIVKSQIRDMCNSFTKYQIIPVTNFVRIVVIRENFINARNIKGGTEKIIWNIRLLKQRKPSSPIVYRLKTRD